MQQTVRSTAAAHGQDKARLWRALLMLAVCAGLALNTVACSGAPANPAAPASASGTGGNITAGAGGSGGSGQRSTGSFSLAFAKCMRAHGVPDFPDPNGQADQLGPGSGFDPNTPQFQSALNGPCRSLAPLGWLNSGTGPVTR
jgi:hypothetical protein